MAEWIPLPLTVSCFSKIQIGFTFLVPAHPGSPRQRAVKQVCEWLYFCGLDLICLVFTRLVIVFLFIVQLMTSLQRLQLWPGDVMVSALDST